MKEFYPKEIVTLIYMIFYQKQFSEIPLLHMRFDFDEALVKNRFQIMILGMCFTNEKACNVDTDPCPCFNN